jgi:hypothetical protein
MSTAANADLYECELRTNLLTGRKVVGINGKDYLVEVQETPWGVQHVLTKLGEGAEAYVVAEAPAPDGELVWCCTCKDFTFRRKRRLKLSCKHTETVAKLVNAQTPTP